MSPADPPREADPPLPARRRKLRLGILLGLLLLVLAVNAVGLQAFHLPQRFRVGLVNDSDRLVRNVRVQHEGIDVPLAKADGTDLDPNDQVEHRFPGQLVGKVRVTFDITRRDGWPDDRVEAELTHRWEPGEDSIRFNVYDGKVYAVLNDKMGLLYKTTFKITPGKQP